MFCSSLRNGSICLKIELGPCGVPPQNMAEMDHSISLATLGRYLGISGGLANTMWTFQPAYPGSPSLFPSLYSSLAIQSVLAKCIKWLLERTNLGIDPGELCKWVWNCFRQGIPIYLEHVLEEGESSTLFWPWGGGVRQNQTL